jgi:nitroreductase
MDIKEAMVKRHSVRSYTDRPVEEEKAAALRALADGYNKESGLHIQLVTDEPKAFGSAMAKYGSFSGVSNYIALIGKDGDGLDELCGYYGEKLVLEAQMMGLNTCWVALTYKKVPDAYEILPGEKLLLVISLGYGKDQGVPHRSKKIRDVSNVSDDTPDWFGAGVEAALLAPTAMNQQKFRFTYEDGKVEAKPGVGFYTKVDLGIAKYHFEIGSGRKI